MASTATALAPGTLVRVRFSARISGTEKAGADNTTEVVETGDSEWTHLLFLGSDSVTANPDGTLTADFTGRVGPGNGQYATTPVKETGRYGFVHFVFTGSDSVELLPEPGREESSVTLPPTNIEDYLTAGQVRNRIAELRATLDTWAVKRLRNDKVLTRYPTQEQAVAYIIDEDYNPEMVIAAYDPDGATMPPELTALLKLDDDAGASIPGWEDAQTGLVRWSVITSDYAQVLFMRTAPISRDGLDDWPYNYIDWQAAADAIEERRAYVIFDNVRYYQAED